MNSKQRFRTRLMLACVIAAGCVLAAKLYDTDIINGGAYAARAAAQYSKPSSALFDRGTIFFTSKDGTETAAAAVENGYLVYMNPMQVTDPQGDYQALSTLLPLDKASFIAHATKPGDPYEEIAHKVDASTSAAIQGLDLTGIRTAPETWRSYPGGTLAAHILGVIGEDGTSTAVSGRYGLEKYYDSVLSKPGVGPSIDAFASLFSGIKDSVFGGSAQRSGDVVTTIDPAVQAYLEQVLSQTESTWHPDQIGGIVIDPNTGAIVAMASHPTFDPNDLSSVKSNAVLSDPLVESVYEMGSIMKPLTMAAALDSGAVGPDSTYDDTGCMTVSGRKICNYDLRARGPATPMQQILSQSLNVGAATIALKMGADEYRKYFYSYGLGEKSGIDLPDEAAPLSGNLTIGADVDIATASFGQGVAVTPVGMARALSVIANGGYVVTPHVVKEIDYDDGSVVKVDPPRAGPVLSPKTVEEVKNMLVTVVDKAFRPGTIARTHYSQGAKTGTAQIADPVHGGYYADRYLHSFFGFFPAYSPRFLVFFYQVYPKGAEYASETLTAAYNDMAGFLINYYDIPPDR
ncbi:MAG: penicillin-binding protein 2 [Patescibacteria group bacterium]|nr:penicillin-binding protein 2 [Patescibacteria group bacterium]